MVPAIGVLLSVRCHARSGVDGVGDAGTEVDNADGHVTLGIHIMAACYVFPRCEPRGTLTLMSPEVDRADPRAVSAAHREPSRVRGWAVWTLPGGLRAYVLALPLVGGVLAVALALTTPLRGSDLAVFATLLLGAVASVEATHRMGEPAGVLAKDLLSAWWLPAAVLLPPLYALLLPVPLMALTQWRVRRCPVYRRVFSAATIGLAYALAAAGLQAFFGGGSSFGAEHAEPLGWLLAVTAAGAAAAALNTVLISCAVKAADPQTRWRELLADRENLTLDGAELSLAATVTFALGHSPLLVVMVLPVVLLLQRALLHAQLSAAARIDGKTGLLNAVTWEREAEAALARCGRNGQPAAVLLADLDYFKRVNDLHGHLVGDRVLCAVADACGGSCVQTT